MEVRLDRAMTNLEWLKMFPMAKLYNLEGSSSDHSPILLILHISPSLNTQFQFKFENAWMTEPMCKVIVRDGWTSAEDSNILQKIKMCSQNLAIWGKEITGNFSGKIKACKAEMKQFRGRRDDMSMKRYREAKMELTKILHQREIF
ncbi:uncharacterized protein LOC141673190 [Apium graveolens]|uniref:uncharacterized protein LOC141673190 n=1 Tax=Apium graveolens TaxID=4045 RepID=UPI003D7AAEF3